MTGAGGLLLPPAACNVAGTDAGADEGRKAVGNGDAVEAERTVPAQHKGKEVAYEVGGHDGAAHGHQRVPRTGKGAEQTEHHVLGHEAYCEVSQIADASRDDRRFLREQAEHEAGYQLA